MLRWRLLLGALFIAGLVALCGLDHRGPPGVWLGPLLVALAALAAGEMLGLEAAAGIRPVGAVVYAGCVLVPVACFLPAPPGHGAEFWPLLAFSLAVVAAFLAEMRRYERPGGVTANLGGALLALGYVGLLFAVVALLRLGWGVAALASLVIVVKMGDTGAYTVGRLIGRHKMAPVLSPGKTLEGAAGAVAFSLVGAWAAFGWLVPALGVPGVASPHTPAWGWALYGLVVGVAGMMGDLAESLLKRDVGRKDSSAWMPGFGGVLDLVDSILLAAPAAYACWALGVVGRHPG